MRRRTAAREGKSEVGEEFAAEDLVSSKFPICFGTFLTAVRDLTTMFCVLAVSNRKVHHDCSVSFSRDDLGERMVKGAHLHLLQYNHVLFVSPFSPTSSSPSGLPLLYCASSIESSVKPGISSDLLRQARQILTPFPSH